MKRVSLILLLFTTPSSAQTPPSPPKPPTPIVVKAKMTPVAPKGGDLVCVDASSSGGKVDFDHELAVGTWVVADKKLYIAAPMDPTTITIRIVYFKEEIKEKLTIKIGVVPPLPPEPSTQDTVKALRTDVMKLLQIIDKRLQVLEGPRPPPTPPTPPEPKPEPSPISTPGFRVLIVEDKEKLASMPAQQLAIRTSAVFRDYLDSVCVLEADNKTKAYRIWDCKETGAGDYTTWQGAMRRPRTSLPWIIVSNYPKGGYEGPLPANVADTITLLKKVKGD